MLPKWNSPDYDSQGAYFCNIDQTITNFRPEITFSKLLTAPLTLEKN